MNDGACVGIIDGFKLGMGEMSERLMSDDLYLGLSDGSYDGITDGW